MRPAELRGLRQLQAAAGDKFLHSLVLHDHDRITPANVKIIDFAALHWVVQSLLVHVRRTLRTELPGGFTHLLRAELLLTAQSSFVETQHLQIRDLQKASTGSARTEVLVQHSPKSMSYIKLIGKVKKLLKEFQHGRQGACTKK